MPFTTVSGCAAPLPTANIDTDVIMPKQFLKGVDRSGLAHGAFHALRFEESGQERPDFILNQNAWRHSSFLVVGPNFGCGSSREHAVWGLAQLGIKAVIGTSFGGIFFDNCARNGVLAIALEPDEIATLMALASSPARNTVTIDLENQRITHPQGWTAQFEIEPDRKAMLMLGLDAVGITLQEQALIAQFEKGHLQENSWLAD